MKVNALAMSRRRSGVRDKQPTSSRRLRRRVKRHLKPRKQRLDPRLHFNKRFGSWLFRGFQGFDSALKRKENLRCPRGKPLADFLSVLFFIRINFLFQDYPGTALTRHLAPIKFPPNLIFDIARLLLELIKSGFFPSFWLDYQLNPDALVFRSQKHVDMESRFPDRDGGPMIRASPLNTERRPILFYSVMDGSPEVLSPFPSLPIAGGKFTLDGLNDNIGPTDRIELGC